MYNNMTQFLDSSTRVLDSEGALKLFDLCI